MKTQKDRRHAQDSHKRGLPDVPMTPMIDVVFQLLIFFILTFEIPNRLSEMRVHRVGPPDTETVAPGPLDTILMVTASGDGQSPFFLNGKPTTLETLTPYFNMLADQDPTQTIIVRATKDSLHKDLVALLNVASAAGLNNISLFSISDG